MIRYSGVCMVEATLAALLLYTHFMVVIPAISRDRAMGAACGMLALFILAPGFWIVMVVLFIAAKAVVVLVPPARRHGSLAVYWAVPLAAFVYQWLRHPPASVPRGDLWREVVLVAGFYVIAPLVLTLSHFTLIPRVAPGGTALQALRAMVSRAPRR